jgi:uncharacterized protein (DUF1800 family)
MTRSEALTESVETPAPKRHRAGLSRRSLLSKAGAIGAFWGGARVATAQPDVSADVDPGSLLVRLVRHITQGVTETELALAQSLGYQGYLEYHLNYTAIDDSGMAARLAPLTTLTMIPQQLYPLPAGQVINELIDATLYRSIFSTRQLYERMVEFWTNHFSIDINNGDDRYLKTVDDREIIRPYALNTFPAVLYASAHSPAMLYYLDNVTSVAGNPNENYARELMELHTMGVDGGYTQQDVIEVARCFTGWTMYGRAAGALTGTFRYNSAVHDTGQKVVLGNIIPPRPAADGIQDALDVLDILVNHPSTARFISTKLCKWLLRYDPPQSVIDSVIAAYTSTGGDIKAMIRATLAPNVLADAPPKYKRPFHTFVSALRALPVAISTGAGIRTQLVGAGHMPFYWGPPDGYPDTLEYWGGFVLPRWNFGALLMNGTTGSINGAVVDSTTFFSGLTTAQQLASKINQAMFGGEMPATDLARITEFLAVNPASNTRRREAIGLAIGSPGFQWY